MTIQTLARSCTLRTGVLRWFAEAPGRPISHGSDLQVAAQGLERAADGFVRPGGQRVAVSKR
jgi:hypothetical protein